VSAACHRLPVEIRRSPNDRTPNQVAGDTAEQLVVEYLRAAGWRILATNVRVGREELDLVAVDPGRPGALVIVEVRWRRNRAFGLPEETFDRRKRRHVWSAAMRLIELGTLPGGIPLPLLPIRLDLVVVEPPAGPDHPPRLRHYANAIER